MEIYDVIVIGAGQAGLAAGFYLKQRGFSFLLLEQANEVGEVWKNRYDSLVLFTPRFYSSLPGLSLSGPEQGCATKKEIAAYLKYYADHFKLPVHVNTEVRSLQKHQAVFEIQTSGGSYLARHVVIATGPFQKPYIPSLARRLGNHIFQLHTADYLRPAQLQSGPVLVVGAGNSGAQIAVELAKERTVYLSASHRMRFMPTEAFGKNIFWWFQKLGVLEASIETRLGRYIRKQTDPIFGFELQEMLKQGKVIQMPRTVAASTDAITFENNTTIRVENIIWATGFYSDYSWIQIAGVLDEQGKPVHRRGVSSVPHIYLVGLPWQYRRGSALLGGVGEDARYVADTIARREQ